MSTSRPKRLRPRHGLLWGLWCAMAVTCMSGCNIADVVRVPVVDVGAEFTLADATWFEEEETLFIFYRVSAREGLSSNSVVELQYRTDDEVQEFVPLDALTPVHIHSPVVCGQQGFCGSFSVHVPSVPRCVGIRLRYHREGELVLNANVSYHVVATGRAHENRSALVYGVFNEENTRVQWRLRHKFPEIRNQEATALGLMRRFEVEQSVYGALDDRTIFAENPYGYGAFRACPTAFEPHPHDPVVTSARAKFDASEMEIDSYPSPYVCANARVFDALGPYVKTAIAQKNPQTRPAFGALQTPIRDAVPVPFFLKVCEDSTSTLHQEMQMQRLFLSPADVVCIDDWNTADFPNRLATRLSAEIDSVRQMGEDMVLTIALNRPAANEAIAARVERALEFVVAPEIEQSSPRVAGAFIYDTAAYSIRSSDVARVTLWCPSGFGGNNLDAIGDISARSCAFQPTQRIALGDNLSFSQLPILPT